MQFDLKDCEFMTAGAKRKLLSHWQRFLESGLEWNAFRKAIYEHLHLHCEFIAHYNREGFFSVYFGDEPAKTCAFLRQFDPDGDGKSVDYGLVYWITSDDYGDVNQAMREIARPHIQRLTEQACQREREQDFATIKRLLAKHGIDLEGVLTAPAETGDRQALLALTPCEATAAGIG